MPEGDTIYRAAANLDRALRGRRVVRFDSNLMKLLHEADESSLVGQTVDSVSAHGKHLLIAFSGDLVLRTHLRMNGSWHIYRPRERWQKHPARMRVMIETDAFVAVAFDVPVAEFIRRSDLASHRQLSQLGPDLLAESFDEEEAMRRLAMSKSTIADALLDQNVMAGVGNVFKSEILFLCRVDPHAVASQIAPEVIRELVTTSRRLLRENVVDVSHRSARFTGTRRTTHRLAPGEALWAYGRHSEPCRRCGEPIEYEKLAPLYRSTYFCRRCQTRS